MTKVFQKIVGGYPAIVAPESNDLLRIGATLFTLARISTFFNVKIKDGKTTNTFSNIFFLFFGGSGEGKGKVVKCFEQLDSFKAFMAEEIEEIKAFEEKQLKQYAHEYLHKYSVDNVFSGQSETQPGFNKNDADKNEQRKAITYARTKVKNIQPIMSDSTRPNLEATAVAVCNNKKIGVSVKNDEFLIWMKRKSSESFELFEFLAEIYDNGDAITKGTNMANRGVDEAFIRKFPLNVLFLSSEYLMSDQGINGTLKDFFMMAGARRFITASGTELDTPLYTEEGIEYEFDDKKKETDIYIGRFIDACRRFSSSGLKLGTDLRIYIEKDKQAIKEKLKEDKRLSPLSHIEMKGMTWRSLKIAGLIALLNHPDDNELTIEDYKEARDINNLFVKSFKNIVERNWVDEEQAFIDYIRKTPGCSKGDIYKLKLFSRNKTTRQRKYEDMIDICGSILRTDGEVLNIEKQADGRTLSHTIDKIDTYFEILQANKKKIEETKGKGDELFLACPVCGLDHLSVHPTPSGGWLFVCLNKECGEYKKEKLTYKTGKYNNLKMDTDDEELFNL